jgi:CBS domain-containing protein
MRISDVLKRKGDHVVTVEPEQPVSRLLDLLAEHGVGALVVSERAADGEDRVVGIVSERDVVRRLRTEGAALVDAPVSSIMTRALFTCGPDATTEDLMVMMTQRRVRHIPVLVDDRLTGIVSIGDVVKHRIEELQEERDHLQAYITT